MILVLDIGNSQIYGGVFDDERLALQFRRATRAENTSDEFGLFCRQVLREFGCKEVVVEDASGLRRYPFEEILPNSFGPEAL